MSTKPLSSILVRSVLSKESAWVPRNIYFLGLLSKDPGEAKCDINKSKKIKS